MLVPSLVSGLVTTLWVIFAARLPVKLRAFQRIPTDAPARAPAPRISVIIPARNEEEALPRCLAGLAAQDLPPLEVIVVDDDSTDGTRAIAQSAGVRVLSVPKRPTGWMGKTWAAWQGAQVARGDWLLFVDADVKLAPAALRATVAAAERDGAALLTAISCAECASAWESFVQPPLALLVLLHLAPDKVNNPEHSHASASGGFLLFRREAYEAVGGHKAVRDQVMDDFRLASAVKARKIPMRVLNASHLVSIQRPQTSGEIWHQWCRVFGGGLEGRPWMALGCAAAVALAFTGPHAIALWGLIADGPTPMVLVLVGLALLQTCASLAVGALLSRGFGLDPRFVVFQPVSALFAVAALLYAALVSLGGGVRVRWRGRRLRT